MNYGTLNVSFWVYAYVLVKTYVMKLKNIEKINK